MSTYYITLDNVLTDVELSNPDPIGCTGLAVVE
jgi:hypothetical protein